MPPSNLKEVLVARGTNLVVRGFTLSATPTPAPAPGRGEGDGDSVQSPTF